jgi:Phage integrase family
VWRPSRITKSGNPIVVPTFSHAISAKNLTLNRPSYFVRERLRHSQSVVSRPWWNARRPERPALTRKSTRTCCGIAAVTKLANNGVDTRIIQGNLGHKSIQQTVRYTELATTRFKSLFRD